MRIRLWSVFILVGMVGGSALIPWNRVPAREAEAPSPTVPQGCYPVPHTSPITQVTQTNAVAPPVAAAPTITVNNRLIRLNCNIAEVGPSGVSSVELWATRDGQAWQRYSSQPPPNGPLVVHVAEEGRYGFSLVVKSGVGLSSPPPRSGDEPQLWVEVDETIPKVRMLHAEAGKGLEADDLTLAWIATDDNLLPNPVTLSAATSKAGPWTPIATNIENTGKYVWHMPKDVAYQFWVRVEVRDRAGNCGVDCCPEVIRVDRALPRGTIVGIEPQPPGEVVPASGIVPAGENQQMTPVPSFTPR